MMQVLGSFMVGTIEQRQLFDGRSWDIARDRIVPRILAKAAIGDLLWLKEPWVQVTSRQFGPQNIREAIVGPIAGGRKVPAHIKPILHHLRYQVMSALVLAREDSRITLEIMGIDAHAVRVLVHFKQIDEFLQERPAA